MFPSEAKCKNGFGVKKKYPRINIAEQVLGLSTHKVLKKANREVTEGSKGNAESGILKLEMNYIL